MNILLLPFIAAFAANAFLTLGFGIRHLVFRRSDAVSRTLAPALSLCLSGLLAWPLFAYVLAPLSLGYLESIALAPLSVLLSVSADRLVKLVLGTTGNTDRSAFSAYDGLTYAVAFSSLRLCSSYPDALLFSLGASLGYLFCDILLKAIRHRSEVEPVPRCLRGVPLMLIAASFISIFSAFLASALYASLGGRP